MVSKYRQRWTWEETLVVFNRYWHIPFGRLNHRNPEIIELATLMGRTPSSVSMKMCNIASHDLNLHQKGLANASKYDKQVWDEYHASREDLIFESESAAASFDGQTVEERGNIEGEIVNLPEGEDRDQWVKVRTNDNFFRRTVFSAYRSQCCVTGLAMRGLLNACHIIPWSDNISGRLNPRNGLCMNVLHHKAFDLGLMTVLPTGVVKVSRRLIEVAHSSERAAFVVECDGQKIDTPERFYPGREFLEYHNDEIFERKASSY